MLELLICVVQLADAATIKKVDELEQKDIRNRQSLAAMESRERQMMAARMDINEVSVLAVWLLPILTCCLTWLSSSLTLLITSKTFRQQKPRAAGIQNEHCR